VRTYLPDTSLRRGRTAIAQQHPDLPRKYAFERGTRSISAGPGRPASSDFISIRSSTEIRRVRPHPVDARTVFRKIHLVRRTTPAIGSWSPVITRSGRAPGPNVRQSPKKKDFDARREPGFRSARGEDDGGAWKRALGRMPPAGSDRRTTRGACVEPVAQSQRVDDRVNRVAGRIFRPATSIGQPMFSAAVRVWASRLNCWK